MKADSTTRELVARLDALADETRLRLLALLARHELGVAEIREVVQLPQSTVSRHLKVLSERGWISSRRQGTANLYRMRGSELEPAAAGLWELAKAEAAASADARQDALRAEALLARRRDASDAFFADTASRWSDLRRESYGEHFVAFALAALLPAEWCVADLGCGTGEVAGELAPRVKRVIGIDRSPAMLDAARRSLAGHANVELREGTLEEIPISDASVDAALTLLVLTYVPDLTRALAEARRVLKPGGRLVVVDLVRHEREDFRLAFEHLHPGFEPDELARAMKAAGLIHVSHRMLPPEPEAKGPALFLASGERPR